MNASHCMLTAEEAAQRILSIERPLVLTHKNPDGDTVGTAAALLAVFRSLGRQAYYAAEADLPDRLSFLTEGEARALPPFDGLTPIAVDVASLTQLGTLATELGDRPIALSLDHHAVGTPFAPTFCLPDVSSAAEVLFHVLMTPVLQQAAPMNTEIARALYAAISSDTGGFRYANASAETHRIAAALLTFPFDHADIDHRLFSSKSESQIRAEGIAAMRLCRVGTVAYAVIDKDIRESEGLSFSDFECAIDIVRSLRGCEIAFVVKETDSGSCKISLRSTGADVAAVAARLGGGGHIRAAGCSTDEPPAAAAAHVLQLLGEVTV